jgi:hypothetical protein
MQTKKHELVSVRSVGFIRGTSGNGKRPDVQFIPVIQTGEVDRKIPKTGSLLHEGIAFKHWKGSGSITNSAAGHREIVFRVYRCRNLKRRILETGNAVGFNLQRIARCYGRWVVFRF